MPRFSDSTLRLGAYLLVVVLGAVGFAQVQQINAQAERDNQRSAYELCIGLNRNREVLRGLITLGRPLQPPPNADEGLRKLLEDSNRRNADFQERALVQLADQPCPPNPNG